MAAIGPTLQYRLLEQFRSTFKGHIYRHRDSSLGDRVAIQLYEDLFALGKSKPLKDRISKHERVLNASNKRRGIKARRGDGTFGELVPGATALTDTGCAVARGPVATVEIGVEVKILAKAMIKQIDRVIGDLRKQIDHFQRGGGDPLCVGIVGVNFANRCTGYEGERATRTDGKRHKHPSQEAAEAISRLTADASDRFNEFLILRYRATNEPPYEFDWVDYEGTSLDYAATLTRISREYDRRFAKT